MTSILNEAARLFAAAFSSALARVLSRHMAGTWTVIEEPNQDTSVTPGKAMICRITLERSLSGECFVELARSSPEVTEAAAPQGAAAQLPDEVILEILSASGNELAAALASSYGRVTVCTAKVTDNPPHTACTVSLLARGGAGERVTFRLRLSQSLLESLQAVGQIPEARRPVPTQEQERSNDPNLELVLDVELNVTLRFGQRILPLRDVLELSTGSVIELDRQVEEPVELLLDGRVIARGEAVIVDGNYGLRVIQVAAGPELLAR